ncbi:MAG: radical SAM protein [Methanophagales archaeon]|nr:radical SAM protein [Methanophagales archaeon]
MDNNNTRKWLKSHHDTLFPFFPYLKKRGIKWLFEKLREKGGGKGALYIHIPFCTGRCTFCILTREYPSENTLKYVDSIVDEARAWRDYFSSIQTIYVGGGTPTSLSSEELKLLFAGLRDTF